MEGKNPEDKNILEIITDDLNPEGLQKAWAEYQNDCIVGILLLVAVLLVPFTAAFGAIIVGFITGMYFYEKLTVWVMQPVGVLYKQLGSTKFYGILAFVITAIFTAPYLSVSFIVGGIIGYYIHNKA